MSDRYVKVNESDLKDIANALRFKYNDNTKTFRPSQMGYAVANIPERIIPSEFSTFSSMDELNAFALMNKINADTPSSDPPQIIYTGYACSFNTSFPFSKNSYSHCISFGNYVTITDSELQAMIQNAYQNGSDVSYYELPLFSIGFNGTIDELSLRGSIYFETYNAGETTVNVHISGIPQFENSQGQGMYYVDINVTYKLVETYGTTHIFQLDKWIIGGNNPWIVGNKRGMESFPMDIPYSVFYIPGLIYPDSSIANLNPNDSYFFPLFRFIQEDITYYVKDVETIDIPSDMNYLPKFEENRLPIPNVVKIDPDQSIGYTSIVDSIAMVYPSLATLGSMNLYDFYRYLKDAKLDFTGFNQSLDWRSTLMYLETMWVYNADQYTGSHEYGFPLGLTNQYFSYVKTFIFDNIPLYNPNGIPPSDLAIDLIRNNVLASVYFFRDVSNIMINTDSDCCFNLYPVLNANSLANSTFSYESLCRILYVLSQQQNLQHNGSRLRSILSQQSVNLPNLIADNPIYKYMTNYFNWSWS